MTGFAGARFIQQATYKPLPDGFQTAEFLWQHGMIDLVVPRPELPAVLRQLLDLYARNGVAGDFPLQRQAGTPPPPPLFPRGGTTGPAPPPPGSRAGPPGARTGPL